MILDKKQIRENKAYSALTPKITKINFLKGAYGGKIRKRRCPRDIFF